MANVSFKKGLLANLPATKTEGTIYITTDERALYLDVDASTRIRIGDFIQVAAVENLPTSGADTTALYYAVAENILCRYNGSTWVQINPDTDTGATSIEISGSGAKVTEVGYNATTRKITVTLGALAATDIPDITHSKISDWDTEIANIVGDDADTASDDTIKGAKAAAAAKVASVSAADKSVVVGGTTTAPTVGVQISGKDGNQLSLATDEAGKEGLYVPAPAAADTYKVAEKAAANTGYLKTYVLNKYAGGDETGTPTACGEINIPKDFLVKSATVETCAVAGTPAGFAKGDKYIDFVINTKGTDEAEADSHIYLNVNDLVDAYTAGNGIDISTGNVVSIKIDSANANGLSADANGLKLGVATPAGSDGTGGSAGAMSAADKKKLDGIEDGANNYTLPEASNSELGGIKASTASTTAGGVSVDANGVATVPMASESAAGAVVITKSVAAVASASDDKIATEKAVASAISNAAMTWGTF